MELRSPKVKWIFFVASLTLSYSRHISFYNSDVKRILSNNENNVNLCTTPGCLKAAADILSSIDESVDPCDNFYRFACGGWLSSHAIPEDVNFISRIEEIKDDLDLKLRILMDKKLDGTEPPFVKMLKNVYDACMDIESIEKLGSKPLENDLVNLGGWPVVEGSDWDESRFDWVDTLIAFQKLGYGHDMLLSLFIIPDVRNNTFYISGLNQPSFEMLHRDELVEGLNSSATAAYQRMLVKRAVLLGADVNVAEKELLKSLEFQMDVAKYSYSQEELRDVNEVYKKYTVAELQNIIPQFPWMRCIKGLLNDKIQETDSIGFLTKLDYFKNLANLLQNTEKRVVANYIFSEIVSQSSSLLSKEWNNINKKSYSVVEGEKEDEPRWQKCMSHLSKSLEVALSSYYVRQYFKEDSKDKALELVKYIHKEFLNILEDSDWMDDVTKERAIAKANSIKTFIGYPKQLLNDTAIMELHENLTLNNRSHYENALNIMKWKIGLEKSKLGKLYIKGDWKNYAEVALVNAFYIRQENSIAFPAGILQNVFFDGDRPNYMNFGGIGFVIGHEITHGFDSIGKQFDKNGNNLNWWDKTTDEHFHEKARCIIEQYGNYTIENGMKINGVHTQDENIADNGGLKEAYRAYLSWVKDNGPEPLLPGIKFNQKQLFWISTANGWCSKGRPEAIPIEVLTDTHSPAEYRIIGTMSNLPEFSQDFNCPPDSPMNKKKKCQVW